MAFELVYTSVPQGIRPGSSGFCTVAYTNGLAANLIVQLESMSAYKVYFPHYDANANLNPVSYSHFICNTSGKVNHILSRVCFYGQDYTKRSNKLACHVVMSSSETSAVPGGPADALSLDVIRTEWQGGPELFPKQLHIAAPEQPLAPAGTWKQYCGDAGWAGVLAESYLKNPAKPVFIIFDPLRHTDMLSLMREALMLLPPDKRWKVSFNTYFTMMPAGLQCIWRCCVPNSDPLKEARRTPGTLIIDLTKPLPEAAESELVQTARTGISAVPAAPVPSPLDEPVQEREPEEQAAEIPQSRRTAPKVKIPRPSTPNRVSVQGNRNMRKMRNQMEQKQRRSKSIFIWSGILVALLLAAGIAVFVMISIHDNRKNKPDKRDSAGEESSSGILAHQEVGKKANADVLNKAAATGTAAAGQTANKTTDNAAPSQSPDKTKAGNPKSEEQPKQITKAESGNKTETAPQKTTGNDTTAPTAAPKTAGKKSSNKPKTKTSAPIRNASQPYHFVWQDFDAKKLEKAEGSWTSADPVIPKGKKIKKAIVSYEVPDMIDRTDDKEIVLESESLKVTGTTMGGEEQICFDYNVKIQSDGKLQIAVKRTVKDQNPKAWLIWKKLILNDGTEIPLVFELGKVRIKPPKSKIEVKNAEKNKIRLIAVYNLDTVPKLKDPGVQKAVKKVKAVFMKGTKPIAKLPMSFTAMAVRNETSPGHDHLHGVFAESAAVIKNRRKIEFYNYLKKLQKEGKIEEKTIRLKAFKTWIGKELREIQAALKNNKNQANEKLDNLIKKMDNYSQLKGTNIYKDLTKEKGEKDISEIITQVQSLELKPDLLMFIDALYHSYLPDNHEELKRFAVLPGDFKEWEMWGQPVDKIRKILEEFGLNINMANIKEFRRPVPERDLAEKERKKLAARLKAADRVEIYSGGKLIMRVGKGKIDFK